MHIAARRGDAKLVQFLLDCSDVDKKPKDWAGRTPRRLARRTAAARAFTALGDDSDSDTDDDDDVSIIICCVF